MSGVDWLRPGIYPDIAAEDYHADPCRVPSLSAGIAKLLIAKSPRHAWWQHPRLNPRYQPRLEQRFDIGTAVHSLFLEGGEAIGVAPECYTDWRQKGAREARDAIRESGRVPLLEHQWEQAQEMVSAIRDQIATGSPTVFEDGKPEQTVIWEEEGGVMCRALVDYLHDDLSAIDDLKTTGQSANPVDWTRRTFWSIGCDIQAVFHARGVRALTGREPHFRFAVAECEPPYAISIVDLAPAAVDLATRKTEHAIRVWRECLERDEWPAYAPQVASVELDGWQETDFLQRTHDPEEAIA